MTAGRRAWTVAIDRHHRLLAAAAAAVAVTFGLQAVRPHPSSATVLVVTRDLAAGDVLGPADVRSAALPPGAVPVGALRADSDAVGRALVGAARRGEVLTDVRLLGSAALGSALPRGTVAVPVRLADAGAAALVEPGSRIDLLAAPDDGVAQTIAEGVLVVAVPPRGETDDGALIVVATTPSIARALATAAAHARLSIALRGPS